MSAYKTLIFPLMLSVLPAFGQNRLDASVNVDGKYLPEIIRMERIGTFPVSVDTDIPFHGLDYSLKGVTADFSPLSTPLSATAWGLSDGRSPQRGYLDFSLGSWLNSNLSAGYRIIKDEKTSLSTRLQFNSTSLWKDNELSRALSSSDSRQRYDGVIGFDFTRRFSDTDWLAADVQYHLGAFNYYGLSESQTLNDFALRASWNSAAGEDNLNWNVGAGVRYFGYRSGGYISDKGTRETSVNVGGGILMPWSSGSALSLDADLDLMVYADALVRPDNYGMVTLTPAYSFSRGKTLIRVGADVDLTFNAGEEGNRYALFHIAPDCRLMTDLGRVRLALDVTGGSEKNTLANQWGSDYYQSPVLLTTRPVYTPFDGRLELSFGPFTGFSFSLWGEYKISRGVFMGGGYLPMLYQNVPADALRYNLHGFSTGMRLNWKPASAFALEAYGSYQPQNGSTGFFNGLDRAKGIVGVTTDIRPFDRLLLNINYELRCGRSFTFVNSETRMSNLSMLGAEIRFSITDNFYLGAQGCNLLNRRNVLSPSNPSEGIVILGTLGLKF